MIDDVLFGLTLGSALGCGLMAGVFFAFSAFVLTVSSLSAWHKPGAGYLLAGSLLYLVGTILVTILFNVPRNDALAAVDAASADGATLWADYVTSWTSWNHVRTAAALAAAALLTIALCLPRAGGTA